MPNTPDGAGSVALPRVLASALDAFAEQGYHRTTIRDIAAGAGLSVPGLYHHYRSKQDILMARMVAVMDDLLRRTTAALEAAHASSPVARFDALVEALLRFHLERRQEAFGASSEIRSLDDDNRERYVALRDQQQRMITDVVADGVVAGEFDVPHPAETVRAVATFCVGVATWYRPGGLSPSPLLDPREWTPDQLGPIIRAIRTWRGETLVEVAERAGIHWETMRRWETGRARPRTQQLRRLERAHGLGVSLPGNAA